MEKTIELEIKALLPGVETDEDACIRRLETALQRQRYMQRAHLERKDGNVRLCLHYDPETISVLEVQRLAEKAGLEIINRYRHEVIPIEGLDCSDCALVIEHSLGRLDGVVSARMNYAARKLWVEYDSHSLSHHEVAQRIHSLGYGIPLVGRGKWLQEHRSLLLNLSAGLFLTLGWTGGRFFGFPPALSLVLYVAAYLVGGWEMAKHVIHTLRARQLDTDLLMLLAALGAASLGDFAEGALLIFLFGLGHALEGRALDKARSAISALADLAPRSALVRREGTEVEVPVEQLQLKDLVIIRPGDRIPVDGLILAGASGIDQSPVTGESIPVDKITGDKVFAGTINGEGSLEVQVSRLAADSTLARVMRMVEEAQVQKSPTQLVMERFDRAFVPAVLVLTLLVITVPPLLGVPFNQSFLRAMTLLVAASPCALALGAPSSILAGIAQAARHGVLIKGGAHLEAMGQLKAIAFDKTGTITTGSPAVTAVVTFQPERYSDSSVMTLATSLSIRSGHPLSQAIVRAAREKGLIPLATGEVEALPGRGLRSTIDGQSVLVGSLKHVEDAGIHPTPQVARQVEQFEAGGQTVVLVAVGETLVGLIALADTLRPGINDTVKALRSLGIEKTAMLTGDNSRVAASIAGQAGLSDHYAGLMPEDKVAAIRQLVDQYGQVAMVGDGVNDAPALAQATVGIAMGGAGTDVALETADVALMGNNLDRLPFAVGLGQAARRNILQNLVIAMAVIGILGVLALGGWAGIGAAIFIHEGSTLLVVLNALRLLGYARG